MNRELVRTDRLSLTRPSVDDLDRYVELLGDYEVCKMLSRVPYPYDREQGRVSLLKAQDSWRDVEKATELSFQIGHEGEMIGCFVFKKLQETPEIGYWLGRAYWGRGFMSEAVRAAMAWLFENTDHTRIACEAMTDNPASITVAEKVGFRKAGDVGCESVARGATVPAVRMEITRDEFFRGL
ncbi:GNAT family N-acetyltransferase [Labrenzia sp. 011]|uniref:GNAT family N-acetyltransferase n=1 Tax=Labrenzia sp. 011 TaxID=2171494 RepID=UPI000D508CA8|nr:GNAT family N-acetyltransferase [Labrenzia sp. 011]PVB60715.1 N-acetyltransferase [Labrenzia sp. 011]